MEPRQFIRKQVIKIAFFVILLILLSGIEVASSAAFTISTDKSAGVDKIASEVQQAILLLQTDEMTTVIVRLKAQANLLSITDQNRQIRIEKVINALQNMANATQNRIKALLQSRAVEGKVDHFESYWVFNGLAVTATADVIAELAALPEVDTITPNSTIQEPAPQTAGSAPEPNLSVINAPALWSLGFQGQGIVVANMDTGVDVTHPDLSAQWRGGSNSWFDPNGQHSTPIDVSGHGTWTMGVMVGRDTGGTAIGVAPQAQWIAVKIFNDQGSATVDGIHAGYQWLLDPDGVPSTADTPHVVNNSWTYSSPGCYLEFQNDLIALRAAGIVPVFAAGNFGPNSGTSASPANNPEAFAVGGTNNSDSIYTDSSRGPSACGEAQTTYPELVAPGVSIRTSDLFSQYTNATGTSLAAPHVAGGLALLLSTNPNLTVTEQESALLNGAVDLGASGPDNDFGMGRLDILAAYQWLSNGGGTPTPVPTASPTPVTGNVALNKSVTVSSVQDSAHSGSMAVDGGLATFWQTAKAVGKNKLPTEWIAVDLGSSISVGQIVLEWDANYAINYSVQLSNDNNAWVTAFSTAAGDGGNDTITFSPVSARYVKMDSTSWSNSSLRNWLREFEIYADGSTVPTPTPTNTPTSTPTPTPTATPDNGMTMHVGDLDGSSSLGKGNRWDATVIVTVHDANETALTSATVNGSWSSGASGSDSCVTDSAGRCSFTKISIRSNVANVIFTVNNVTHSTGSYLATANHDPDGDSDGTTISVLKP